MSRFDRRIWHRSSLPCELSASVTVTVLHILWLVDIIFRFVLAEVEFLILFGHALFMHPPCFVPEVGELGLCCPNLSNFILKLVHALPAISLTAATYRSITALATTVNTAIFDDRLFAFRA